MKIFIAILLNFVVTVCIGQASKIDTDRPDQTESVNTVPKKWVQFEAGFNYQQLNKSIKELVTPTLLTKYGLTQNIELRLITSLNTALVTLPSGKNRSTVFDVVQAGAKIALWEENKFLPKTSLIFHLGIPGLSSYETDNLLFNTRLTMQHTLSKNSALGYNLGVEFDGYSTDPVFIYTFAPGINLGENWYAYIEAFGTLFNNAEHTIAGGVAYFVNSDFKLDISGGVGISPLAPDHYFSLGASIRFNTVRK